jgi:hypothetical protein
MQRFAAWREQRRAQAEARELGEFRAEENRQRTAATEAARDRERAAEEAAEIHARKARPRGARGVRRDQGEAAGAQHSGRCFPRAALCFGGVRSSGGGRACPLSARSPRAPFRPCHGAGSRSFLTGEIVDLVFRPVRRDQQRTSMSEIAREPDLWRTLGNRH